MMPGTTEITEAVVHVVAHGDAAHSSDGDHQDPSSGDEHGCSGSFHACICHNAPGFLPTLAARVPSATGEHRSELPSLVQAAPMGIALSIFRPPIA